MKTTTKPTPEGVETEVEPKLPKRFHVFDGMTWPLADAPLAWRLRYAPSSVTDSDKMYLASLISAYEEIINCGRGKRERVTRELRLVARAALEEQK